MSLLQKIKFEGAFVEQLTVDIRTVAQDFMVVYSLPTPILLLSHSSFIS